MAKPSELSDQLIAFDKRSFLFKPEPVEGLRNLAQSIEGVSVDAPPGLEALQRAGGLSLCVLPLVLGGMLYRCRVVFPSLPGVGRLTADRPATGQERGQNK